MPFDDADEPGQDRLVRSMVAYQGGQISGFEELYAALAGDLERFFAGARQGEAVKDLVQDTFLEIHRSRRVYLPPRPVRPWVFGLARNILRRHRRAAWRLARHEGPSVAAPSLSARDIPARVPVRRAFDTRDVEEALRRLPAARREAWMLHHLYGWSFPEIAARLRIGIDAAKLRSSRAMTSLREALGVERSPNRRTKGGRERSDREGGAL